MYGAWVTRRRYRFIQVRCPLFDEVLFTLWDHYYVFAFGSIRELTASHTLVTEEFVYFTLLCSLSAIGIGYLMSSPLAFDLTFTMEGGGERGHCCSIASCIGYFELFCALLYTLLCCAYPSMLLYMCRSTAQRTVYLHRQELSVINGQFCR